MRYLFGREHRLNRSSHIKGRRRQCLELACLAAILIPVQVTGGGPCCAESLRQAADRAGMLVGAAVSPDYFNEAAYASTLAREFNMAEPENALKWEALRPSRKRFDFAAG